MCAPQSVIASYGPAERENDRENDYDKEYSMPFFKQDNLLGENIHVNKIYN